MTHYVGWIAGGLHEALCESFVSPGETTACRCCVTCLLCREMLDAE